VLDGPNKGANGKTNLEAGKLVDWNAAQTTLEKQVQGHVLITDVTKLS
jgi:hypothetical protein